MIIIGGSIRVEDNSVLSIKNTVFQNNNAKRFGAAIKIQLAELYIYNSSFKDNFAEDGSFLYSFDVLIPIEISQCNFSNNTSGNNLINAYYTNIHFEDCFFYENPNSAIFGTFSIFNMNKLDFQDNKCNIDYGCLINGMNSNISLKDAFITSKYGGDYIGIIYIANSFFEMNSSFFKEVRTNKQGACVFLKDSNATFSNDKFNNFYPDCIMGEKSGIIINSSYFKNDYEQIYGTFNCFSCTYVFILNSTFNTSVLLNENGAVNIKDTKKIQISRSIFFNNTAKNAGALYILNSNTDISFCIFEENHAILNGGGIYHENKKDTIINSSIYNCVFVKNTAKIEGGALKLIGEIPELSNNRFNENSAVYGPNIASYPFRLQFKVLRSNTDSKNNFFI